MLCFMIFYLITIVDGQPLQYSYPVINHYVPTVSDIKVLEREVWRATLSGDVKKALQLETKLEADVLNAALDAVVNGKNSYKSRKEIQELGMVVRRDKRAMQTLSGLMQTGAVTGLDTIADTLGREQINGSLNNQLTRKPREEQNETSDLQEIIENEIETINITRNVPENGSPEVTTPATSISHQNESTSEANAPKTPEPAPQEENPDEDTNGGGIGGLISSFLGSLSTPEGGIDLNAVTGLIGGLSTQNADGTYDFTGLQDTIGSLFGGNDEGGSNVGLFLGGLLGAVIRGTAGAEGAKGAGRLAGNLFTGILPGLSAFPTKEGEPEPAANAKPALDSGGFFAGLISSTLGGSSGPQSGGGAVSKIMQVKFSVFRSLFSLITHVFGSSSG